MGADDTISQLLLELGNLESDLSVLLGVTAVTPSTADEHVGQLSSVTVDSLTNRLDSICCLISALNVSYASKVVITSSGETPASSYINGLISVSLSKLLLKLVLSINTDINVSTVIASKLNSVQGLAEKQKLLVQLVHQVEKNG
jgi:hypothetical protein